MRNLKQQWTVQAPGGFPDADTAGNSPRSGGLEGELRKLKKGGTIYE